MRRKSYSITVRGDNGNTRVTLHLTDDEADVIRLLGDHFADAEDNPDDRTLTIEEAA